MFQVTGNRQPELAPGFKSDGFSGILKQGLV
jgi:hypothetical protein